MSELDPNVLRDYLITLKVPVADSITCTLISGGRSNLTYRVTDGVHRWILRRPPLGNYHPGAHDVLREHRVMDALRHSDVPVPTMVATCADPTVIGAPFYVMAEVAGTVFRTRAEVESLSTASRTLVSGHIIDTLADLHHVDPLEVGLEDLGRPQGYLGRQLDRWERQYQATSARHTDVVARIVDGLRRNLPASEASGIVHGDYRLDNVIIQTDNHRVAAVLDWEMATLGDTWADFATFMMFWDEPGTAFNPISAGLTALEGFHTRDQVIARYAQRRRLDDVPDLSWYLTFARFKLAVILEQIHARHNAGQTRGDGFDGIGDMVDQLLGECAANS